MSDSPGQELWVRLLSWPTPDAERRISKRYAGVIVTAMSVAIEGICNSMEPLLDAVTVDDKSESAVPVTVFHIWTSYVADATNCAHEEHAADTVTVLGGTTG
jgi:hypothetical protein